MEARDSAEGLFIWTPSIMYASEVGEVCLVFPINRLILIGGDGANLLGVDGAWLGLVKFVTGATLLFLQAFEVQVIILPMVIEGKSGVAPRFRQDI